MLSDKKKKIIILTFALGAFLIDAIIFFGYFMSHSQVTRPITSLLFVAGFNLWGWAPAFGLATTAIVTTLLWKPGSRALRLFVMFLSVIALTLASLWLFGLYFITHLNP